MSGPALAITYPPELPVSAARDEIARALETHQVIVVAGATGSGKTTQLPKICLELGREGIGHTQPRRIAARSVAERIAFELGVDLGGVVGYQVRFDDRAGRDTAVKVMTDGVLLAELANDRDLRRYDTIIIDEAHERSLTIDFLLGYLRTLLPRRPDLKVIVTSATIDPESFARHFAAPDGAPAPVIEVSGRTYPVEVRYRPLVGELQEDENGEPSDDRDVLQGIAAALDELEAEPPGDTLVFLSGEAEIRDAEDALRSRPHTEVVPLYGRLSAADQHRVFDTSRAPGIRRRVVLATNVAETSLTVPGIRYVVDAGTARISRYSPRAKVQRLPIEAISKASADQRAGRAGRTAPGVCIRLYAEEDFEKRPAFTDPEILRTDLAAVILQMLALELGDIAAFPFLQPPDSRGVKDGLDLLAELGAVTPGRGGTRLTRIGRELSRLPVDVRFGRMLLEAQRTGVAREVAAIVAGLTIQDPRERPLERREQADAAHRRFADPTSDFLTLLNLWRHLEQKQAELSGSAFRRLCRSEFLNYLRIREWQDLNRQLSRALKLGRGALPESSDGDAVHRALLAGLLSRIGVRDREKRDYLGARGQRFVVFPGSVLAKRIAKEDRAADRSRGKNPGRPDERAPKAPEAVMVAELVETSRLFGRTVAAIDPGWAEKLAGDLAKRSHSEPHWEKKQGSAVAFERVTLYGIPLIARRRVQLGRIDPPLARELFIRHALVEGDWPHPPRGDLYAFDRANRDLRAELADLEERTRRRDILLDDEAVVEFYDRRIPAEVTDVRGFERWWKDASAADPDLLTLRREDLLPSDDDEVDDAGFPPAWESPDGASYPLRYRFSPGADDDGVTIEIPVERLAQADLAGTDWLVPGLREELVTALIKALPKPIRKNVVPAADWARRLLPQLDAERPLLDAFADVVRPVAHARVAAADVDLERVPANLRMTYAAVDHRGRRLGIAKDPAELRARFAERTRESVARVTAPATPGRELERAGLTSWPRAGDAPDGAPVTVPDVVDGDGVRGYPALVDEGTTVALRVFARPDEATAAHPRGVRRLVALAIPTPRAYVEEHLTAAEKLALAASPYASTAALLDDVLLAVVDDLAGERAPRDEPGFATLRDEISRGVLDGMFAAASLTARVLGDARDADRAISRGSSLALMSPLGDARGQLEALVHPGFVRLTGLPRLRRVPVYLAGLRHRVEKLPENPGRDRGWQNEVEQATALYREAGGDLPLTATTPARLVPVRWMIEELRLSLFAQHLGADGPVSVVRIRKALAAD